MIALATVWLLIGIGFGVAAVASGIVAKSRVVPSEANMPAMAVVGILLGGFSIVLGIGLVGLFVWLNWDPSECYPVKLHAGCY